MNLLINQINVTKPEQHQQGEYIKLSMYLGRNSKAKDKFLNLFLKEKEAEKLLEELMRAIWENKIENQRGDPLKVN